MKALKAILAIAIVVYVVIAAFKLGPVYMNYLGFKDDIAQEARKASYSTRDEHAIRSELSRSLVERDIPLKPEDLNVQKSGQNVSISCDYTVTVDLPLHPVDLHFHVAFDSTGNIGQLPR